MGHLTSKSYYDLQKRLDEAVQGGPRSEDLHKLLDLLFSEEEAKIVASLPLSMFFLEDLQKKLGKTKKECKEILNRLADKGILFDFNSSKGNAYFLAPTMAGFFEFALMRTDNSRDHGIFSELLTHYLNNNRKFVNDVFLSDPLFVRIYAQEEYMPFKKTVILDYERASEIIKNAYPISIGRCFCRHKQEHLGKKCKYPQETCMTLNKAAESLIKHKLARKISRKKALSILKMSKELGLVQLGDNVQDEVNWICNCCSCCCEGLKIYKKFGNKQILSSNFVAVNNIDKCIGCKICFMKCPVNAIHKKKNFEKKYFLPSKSKCIGCGICVRFCPSKSLALERVKNLKIVPKDTFERIVMIAINKGKLQNYFFENKDLMDYRILKRFIGFILSLEPSKRLLAQKQLRSRFLYALTKTKSYSKFNAIYNKKRCPDYSHKEIDLIKGK